MRDMSIAWLCNEETLLFCSIAIRKCNRTISKKMIALLHLWVVPDRPLLGWALELIMSSNRGFHFLLFFVKLRAS